MWSVRVNNRGYLQVNGGKHRDKYLHRAVWEEIAGCEVPDGFQVHHQDLDKHNCCPENLIAMPIEFNRHGGRQCPYTGVYLSFSKWKRRMGEGVEIPPF